MDKTAFTFKFRYTPEGGSEVKETGLVDIPTASTAGRQQFNEIVINSMNNC